MNEEDEKRRVSIFWNESQKDRLLCPISYHILYPPMQLLCCGLRICVNCSKFKLDEHFKCPTCSELNPKAQCDRGYQREVENLIINCPRCGDQWFGCFDDLLIHLNDHRDLKCDDCDEMFILPEQLDHHQHHNCSHRLVDCDLSFIGCSHKIRFNRIEEHYSSDKHQQCLLRFLQEYLTKFSPKSLKINEEKTENELYRHYLQDSLDQIQSVFAEIQPINDRWIYLKSQKSLIEQQINELRDQLIGTKESFDKNAKTFEDLFQLYEQMNKLINEIKLKSSSFMKLIQLDNKFIWKVNILHLLDDEQQIQSDSFQTSPSGYRLALSLDTYRDISTQQRFLAVSIHFLPGQFDSILFWPFPFLIKIGLNHLNEKSQDIIHSIPKCLKSSVYGQIDFRNKTPYRIAPFCSMETILQQSNNYVQNESFFIKAEIQFD